MQVVVVSIQYRLGGLGFMAMSALRNEMGSYNSSGNYGIMDQILGLQWIQNNVHGFGGDPSQVTVFGESAGAYSVCVLLASPLVHGISHLLPFIRRLMYLMLFILSIIFRIIFYIH